MEIIFAVEPDMVANSICTFTLAFFSQFESRQATVTWQQAELAVYLVVIYGEVCKGTLPLVASNQYVENNHFRSLKGAGRVLQSSYLHLCRQT
jgi:hypothetical protein